MGYGSLGGTCADGLVAGLAAVTLEGDTSRKSCYRGSIMGNTTEVDYVDLGGFCNNGLFVGFSTVLLKDPTSYKLFTVGSIIIQHKTH